MAGSNPATAPMALAATAGVTGRALSESSTFSFFGAELDEASFGGALAGIIAGVVLFCILCFCFGRRVLMRYCLGRPYYCCCCPCIELCGCCQGFKRPGVPHAHALGPMDLLLRRSHPMPEQTPRCRRSRTARRFTASSRPTR